MTVFHSKKIWAIALMGIAATSVLTACASDHESAAQEVVGRAPVPVETAVVELVEIPLLSTATGSAEPWRRVSPGTKLLGRVDEVLVREGDRVTEGQLLASLESRDLEAAVDQARASVTMAEANLENAEAQHRRMVDLHEQNSVTDKNLEDATAGFRVAKASLELARANLAAAEVTLSYAEVHTPISGWVISKIVEVGDMTAPGAPMFVIEDLSRIKVTVTVPEAEVPDLEAGSSADVHMEVLPEKLVAKIDRIMPSGDRATRTFTVQLLLDNPAGTIKSGMFARVDFTLGDRQALLVPESSILRRGQLEGILVVGNEGVAQLRWVKLGRHFETRVEVLSGLEPGDRYIVSPAANVSDGTPVTAR
jgi:RND family efflux transporter MFP subunit